jgi:hypothetical protein
MDSRLRRVTVAGLVASLLFVGSAGQGAAPASAAVYYDARLTGAAVVPGPGDEAGAGDASFTFDAGEGRICLSLWLEEVADATSIDLWAGAAADPGSDLIVSFGSPEDGEYYDDCLDVDLSVVAGILADPGAYFIQVASVAFPDGAIRGQIEATDVGIRVSYAVAVCPGKVNSASDLDDPAKRALCAVAVRTGDLFEPPAGYRFDPKPIAFDHRATFTDSAGTRTLVDSELEGGGSCDSITKTCSASLAYVWYGARPGPTVIRQLTVPTGYRFGAVRITGDVAEGAPIVPVVDTSARTIAFDTSDVEFDTSVVVYFLRRPQP